MYWTKTVDWNGFGCGFGLTYVDRDTCFGDSVDFVDSVDSDDLGRLFYFLVPTSCLVSSTGKENGSNGSRV